MEIVCVNDDGSCIVVFRFPVFSVVKCSLVEARRELLSRGGSHEEVERLVPVRGGGIGTASLGG